MTGSTRHPLARILTAVGVAGITAVPLATSAVAAEHPLAAVAPTPPFQNVPGPLRLEVARLTAAQDAVEARAAKQEAARRAAAARKAAAIRKAEARAAARRLAVRRAAEQRAAVRRAAEQRAAAERARRAQPSGSPRDIARAMLAQRGQSGQFGCLDSLWSKESGWSVTSDNPGSSAYGIPQALPGSKMASAGADWRTNPATQIRWGLGYISASYGSPCAAWSHSQANNWY